MSIYGGQANSSDYRALTAEEKSRLTDALLKQGCRNPKAMKFDVETILFLMLRLTSLKQKMLCVREEESMIFTLIETLGLFQ